MVAGRIHCARAELKSAIRLANGTRIQGEERIPSCFSLSSSCIVGEVFINALREEDHKYFRVLLSCYAKDRENYVISHKVTQRN